MEIINKKPSPESNVKVEITGGKIIMLADYKTAGVEADSKITVDSDYFIDELAKKIPGTLDDAIFAVLKSALKNL